MHAEKLIRLDDLAEQTGLPAAWLQREADGGRIPCLLVGRSRMFDRNAVLHVLAERAAAAAREVKSE
jgi:hypothetical protein